MTKPEVVLDVGSQLVDSQAAYKVSSYGGKVVQYGKDVAAVAVKSPVTPILAVGVVVVAGIAVWQYGNYKIAEEYRRLANDMLSNIKCPEGFYGTLKVVNDKPERAICEQAVDIEKKVSVITTVAEKACGGSSNYKITITEDNAVSYECVHLHGESGPEVFV